MSSQAAQFEGWNVKVKVILQGQRSNWRSKTCNFNIGHNFSPIADSNFIFGMCNHLIKTNNLMGDMSWSRSNRRSKMCNFNNGHNFLPIADSNFIFCMCIHLIKTSILMGEMSRSRSSFKVKGQIEGQKHATLTLGITFHLQIATWYLVSGFIAPRRTIWWVTCQGHGHTSRLKVKVKNVQL